MQPTFTEEELKQLLAEGYTDRNLLAQLLAWVAVRHGWPVYWMVDPAEPEWPVLTIELPTGQITYHIARSDVLTQLTEVENRWDGHSTEEKRARIRRLIAPRPADCEEQT